MRLGLVSSKGSPGVTTLALGAAAIMDAIAVELDPSGGDVECRLASRDSSVLPARCATLPIRAGCSPSML